MAAPTIMADGKLAAERCGLVWSIGLFFESQTGNT